MLYSRTAPAVEWHIRNDLRGLLLDGSALRIDEWRQRGQLTEIKNSPHRAVMRVVAPNLDCHIKHYRLGDFRSRVREFLRGCKAQRESLLAERLTRLGIATPTTLGWGRETDALGATACWLITETIPGQTLLQLFDSGPMSALERQNLAVLLGRWLANLHRAGVVHQDLHPGNILVTPTDQLALLDLHCVRIARRIRWRQRRNNLVVFNRYFMVRACRSDRLRFWRAYAEDVRLDLPAQQAGREIERRTLASNMQFWLARDGRCLHQNRYYRRIHGQNWSGWRVSELDAASVEDVLQPGESGRTLKSGRSSTVEEVSAMVCGRPVRAVLKWFHRPRAIDPWLARFRRTPALRSWVNGQALRERCLPTARPLAVGQFSGGERGAASFVVTELIENAVELSAWFANLNDGAESNAAQELRRLIPEIAAAIRQLHERGLAHRDLKAANILLTTEGSSWRVWFIDLVGVSRRRHVPVNLRAANLARLNASFVANDRVTRTDRLRFLRAYLQWGLLGRGGWKDWWRSIARATEAKVAKNNRSGRPLA